MTPRAFILLGLCFAVAGCAAPGRVAVDDASLDRQFIERFGLPNQMPPQGATNRPAPALARSSPWRIFGRLGGDSQPAPKGPPPIPAPRVEPIPRAPARDVSWQPNTYEWNGKGFVWQPGRWVRVPPGLAWQYGTWTQNYFGDYVWRTGGWLPPGQQPPPLPGPPPEVIQAEATLPDLPLSPAEAADEKFRRAAIPQWQ